MVGGVRELTNPLPSIHAQMLDLCLEGARLASRRLAVAEMMEASTGEYLRHLQDELAELDHALSLWEDRMHGMPLPE